MELIHRKVIDLSNFRNGVTLFLKFKNVTDTFLIEITDVPTAYPEIYDPRIKRIPQNETVYYKRLYNKAKLQINLPVHPQWIQVKVYGGPQIDSYIIDKIRIQKIPYQFETDLIVPRRYPISEVKIQRCRNLPHGTQARFLYDYGIIQTDEDRMSKLPQPVRQFILGHELGHYYYNEERPTDRFALYQLNNQGYNLSNLMDSLTNVLSLQTRAGELHHLNISRILSVFQDITKLHKLQHE